jgi:ornithine decarboxylase
MKVLEELEEGIEYTLKGCTPDSADIFRYKVKLKDPKVGGKIYFINAGAYNFHSEFMDLNKIKYEIKEDF